MNILRTLGIEPNNPGACSGPNQWTSTCDQGEIESYNPATGKLIAKVQGCSNDDYESVVQASIEAQKFWRTVPAPKRGELIRRIGNALREQKHTLGNLVAMEMGKIKQEGDGEVQEMIDIADFALGQSRMLYGKTMHSERPLHRMYEQWHPLGVVGIITAFNFPVAVWAWNAFIAAIAGNTVIWKPSSQTPLCAIAVQRICNKIMADMGYTGIFSLFVPKQHDVAEALVMDKRVPLISFTGSSAVGRQVSEKVAKRLGRSLLELSGNNAIIVDETADLDLTVPAAVFGAVGTAGQRCTTTRRLLIHQNIYEDLCARLVHAYEQVSIGSPLDEGILMGPLINQSAVENYKTTINTILIEGGDILYGGNPLQGPGYFVEPTIARVDSQCEVIQTETFAPILYVMPYKDLHEAITLHNNVPQGLSSAMFTTNLKNAEYFLSAMGSDCGIANINIGTSGAEIGGAFGGEKDTGGGREAGSDSWKAYMRRQTNTINWGTDLPLAQGIEFKLNTSNHNSPSNK